MDIHYDEPATRGDLDQLKQELVAKIDANGAQIDQVEERLSTRMDEVEYNLSAKIDANSATLSRVSHQVVENREQIGRLVTMSEKFNEYFDEIISTLDGLASGFAHLDSERTAMNARIDRMGSDVEGLKAKLGT